MKGWLKRMFRSRGVKGVYYDPKTNKFVEVREVGEHGLMCGGFCDFYEDAFTVIIKQLLSREYIKGCDKVYSIDQMPDIAKYNGIGWQAIPK